MKLSPTQVQRVQEQIDGQIIPDEHALSSQLEQAFGEHTFIVDSEGLNIVEPLPEDGAVGNVVKLASWADDAYTTLEPTLPEAKPDVIQLGSSRGDGEDRG